MWQIALGSGYFSWNAGGSFRALDKQTFETILRDNIRINVRNTTIDHERVATLFT